MKKGSINLNNFHKNTNCLGKEISKKEVEELLGKDSGIREFINARIQDYKTEGYNDKITNRLMKAKHNLPQWLYSGTYLNSSIYYNVGDKIIRISDHGGTGIRSCNGGINNCNYDVRGVKIGIAHLESFIPNE